MGWCLYCKCMIQPKHKIHSMPHFWIRQTSLPTYAKTLHSSCVDVSHCYFHTFPGEEMISSTISQNKISQHSDYNDGYPYSLCMVLTALENILISRSKKSNGNFFSEHNYYFIQVIGTWHADGNPCSTLANSVYVLFFLISVNVSASNSEKQWDFLFLTLAVRCFEFQMLQISFSDTRNERNSHFRVQCGQVHAFTFVNALTY